MNTNYFRKHQALIIIVSVSILWFFALWFCLYSGVFYVSHNGNEPERQALLKIREELEIGDDYGDVLRNYRMNNFEGIRLSLVTFNDDVWEIRMRKEFLETDWKLYIFFENSEVVGHQILTSDGVPPSDAPKKVGVTK